MWPFNNLSSAPAVTKSWPPPTTTRCAAAHQPHHLRHVATCAPNTNHSTPPPPPPHPHTHFLGEGASIVDAVHENPGVSQYRCILKSDTRAKCHPPSTRSTTPHKYQPYVPGLELQLNAVIGPGSLTAGLQVSYTVYRRISRGVFSGKSVSVWHECATADPFDAKKKFMELVSLVQCRGKLYAMSLQGALAVMQVVDTRLRITAVGDIRAAPFSNSSFFKEYMFEMNGEILLVFLIYRKSLAVVDHVEVLRLDLDKLCWIKVERLKGKTLFLKERCICVDSEEFGCRDDRVYFTEGSEKR